MKRFLVSLIFAFVLVCSTVDADDGATARQLEALGGKVTVADGHVTQVSFRNCKDLGDVEFRAIGRLEQLKSLTLYGSCQGLTDATIGHLSGLQQLETLNTDGIRVSDEGLKHLGELKNLRSAAFFHTSFRMEGFTGVGFGHLKDCPKLERLTVAGISMGDEAFAAIAGITQLRELSTWHTYQSEAGNAHIARLPNLRSLWLGQRLPYGGPKAPSLGDASLSTLATIMSLETLKIGEAHFTLSELAALQGLPKLKQLTLYETDFPAAEVDQLRALLPGVKIEFQPLTDEQRKKLDTYLRRS